MKRIDREHREQCNAMQWLELQHPHVYEMAYAVPNGSLRNKIVAAKIKREGGKKGVPDLVIDFPFHDYHGLRVEMKAKRPHSAAVSKEQKEWIANLRRHGYAATVAYGFEAFVAAVEDYLSGSLLLDKYENKLMPEVRT